MEQRRGRLWLDAAVAGATAGILGEVMVYRLNPEVSQTAVSILIGAVMWASWGALGFGLPLFLVAVVVRQIARRREGWSVPALVGLAYVVASIMSKANADLHEHLLSPSAQLVMRQDAVAWGIGALVALLGGAAVRRRGATPRLRYGFALLLMVLPLVRFLMVSTPPDFPLDVATRAIGEPERRLVVVGVEGLDSGLFLGSADDPRYPTLAELRRNGSWGPLRPHRPYLRRAAWTSVATGCYPDRHGVKSRWGWLLPWLPGEPLRLLPWTPQGSRLILPWGIADRVTPPAASVPPIWERVRASGVATEAVAWPGVWGPHVTLGEPRAAAMASVDPDVRSSLQWALEPFPERGEVVRDAIVLDAGVVAQAVDSLESGSNHVWLTLTGLAAARRQLEPTISGHTREREVLAVALQVLDDHLRSLFEAAGPGATIAVVSPYGLAPPDSWERLARLLGVGDDWRTSAESSPEGLLLMAGPGVSQATRFPAARLPDVAPTLCYLVGLPTAQYMQGGLVVDAVQPEFLEAHPLRVVD